MEIIFGLIGLVFLIVVFAGFVFLAIFLARKIGLLKTIGGDEEGEPGESDSQIINSLSVNMLLISKN